MEMRPVWNSMRLRNGRSIGIYANCYNGNLQLQVIVITTFLCPCNLKQCKMSRMSFYFTHHIKMIIQVCVWSLNYFRHISKKLAEAARHALKSHMLPTLFHGRCRKMKKSFAYYFGETIREKRPLD